jgi:two-component system CitB family sensor kinase
MRAKHWPVARQLLVLQVLLLILVMVIAAVSLLAYTRNRQEEAARSKVLGLAISIGDNPFVAQAVTGSDPSVVLQPYAEQIRVQAAVDFVVIMSPARIRYTHPTRSEIGKPFIGDIGRALQGQPLTETYTGTLGPSVRAVAPVRDATGQVVALVAVGVTTNAIRAEFLRQLPYLLTALALLLAIAVAGAVLVARRLRRQTRGLDSDAISQMYASNQAVLHSIREGLLVVGSDHRVGMINDEALRLLGLSGDAVGSRVSDLGVADSIKATLLGGDVAVDELHLTGERLLLLSQSPTEWQGRAYGTVVTLRDRTELEALTGELDTTKAFAEALRSQAHEAANRMHTMVVLVETGRSAEAVAFATAELELSQRLTDQVVTAVEEPVLVALLLGKAAQANERGVELTVAEESRAPAGLLPGPELVTVVGNLVDNAIDASAEAPAPRRVTVTVRAEEQDLVIQVQDTGPGLAAELREAAFTRGWSTKVSTSTAGRGLGLALVNQVVTHRGGSLQVDTLDVVGTRFTVRLPAQSPAKAAS